MTPAMWIAAASFAFTVLLSLVGFAYALGKHSQRIAALEEKTKDLPVVAVLTASLAEMKDQLKEVATDVKNLLTGRVQPARRRNDGD